MTKKERHKYSKLITQKLLSLGLKDQIIERPTNRYVLVPDVKEDGTLSSAPKKVFMVIASNPLRNLVRNLRSKASKEEIELFLKSEPTKGA
jgi:hypothetical protein